MFTYEPLKTKRREVFIHPTLTLSAYAPHRKVLPSMYSITCWNENLPSLGLPMYHKEMIWNCCSDSNHITHLVAQKHHRQSRWHSEAKWRQRAADGLLHCSGSAPPGCAWAGRSWCPQQGWLRRCTPTLPGQTVPAERKCWSFPLTCASGFPLNSQGSACWSPQHSLALEW